IGTQHNYGYLLGTGSPFGAQSITLITPDNVSISFALEQDGTYRNTTFPAYGGAVMTVDASNQVTLRRRDGRRFVCQPDGLFLSRMVSVSDSNGNTIQLTRNPANKAQLTEVVDPVGRKLTLTYDAANRITSISDPIGRRVLYTYDALGRLATFA